MSEIKRYNDIPELSGEAAYITPKSEYTYIINAEKYQQTGEIEAKRVLKKDLIPEASVSYIFFKREGCHGYPINAADLSLKSPSGYVGPFQMNAAACNTFLKHVKENYPDAAKYIKGTGTAGYLNLVKNYPDKEKMINIVEEYALSDYFNNRVGKPKDIAQNLAKQLNKTDENGEPDATRLPLHAIASMPTGVIARGNGVGFRAAVPSLTESNLSDYCAKWISCKAGSSGHKAYETLKNVDYITPEIISQYQTMNLAGADKLQEKYAEIVTQKEDEKYNAISRLQIKNTLETQPIELDLDKIKLRQDLLTAKLDQRKKKKEKEKQPTQNSVLLRYAAAEREYN